MPTLLLLATLLLLLLLLAVSYGGALAGAGLVSGSLSAAWLAFQKDLSPLR